MPGNLTRIKNNQITDTTIVANAKVVPYSISSGLLANNLVYGSDFTVSGNLTVNGTTTTVDTINTLIKDPLITLADGQTAGIPTVDIGTIGLRGSELSAVLAWQESNDRFVAALSNTTVSNTTFNLNQFADFAANNISANGNLTVSGNTTFTGNVSSLNVTGNITGGNIRTPGSISAIGNVQADYFVGAGASTTGTVIAGNLATGGTVSATGNITGGNILFGSGVVSGTGNIYANNIFANISGNIDAAGNINEVQFNGAGDLLAASAGFTFNPSGNVLTANGNINGANFLTTGAVSATGNVTGNWFVGNVDATVVSATANITGGNLLTGGLISATANVTGGNITTAGQVSATANVTGGNIATTGQISAAGNATAGNIATAGQVSATGNIDSGANIVATANVIGGNITTAGVVSATGNVTGGNILTTGLISATGNITGGNIISGNAVIGNINVSGDITVNSLTSNTYVSATGNVTGGNVLTSGIVSATGNATAGNISTAGQVSATGNVTGGNVLTSGIISATGDATAGNISTAGQVSATGNVSGNNVSASNTISSAGNVTGGNILTGGIVSATGNITTTGFYFGNGFYLDGVANAQSASKLVNGTSNVDIPVANGNVTFGISGSANVVVVANTGISTTGLISASGNISGANINAGANITAANIMTGGLISATGNITTAGIVKTSNIDGATGVTITTGSGNLNLYPAANVELGNRYITGLQLTPQQDADAASKYYVDQLVTTAISYHDAVFAATISNLATATGGTITYNQPNGASNGIGATLTTTGSFNLIDTANVQSANTRILVKNEANAAHNGIYAWSNATVITRAADEDTYGAATANALSINDYFFVTNGNVNLGSAWIVDAPAGVITFGTSNIQFAQFSQSQVYSANTSAGLNLIGQTFSAKVDNDTTAFDGGGNIIVKAGANLVTPNIGNATGTTLSVTGNIDAGNLRTAGQVSATANVTGGNILTSGLISATGNATAGNIATAGQVSATGNINSGANIVATANVIGGNISTAGQVTATGNVTGGNVFTGGVISATGNIDSGANIVAIGNVTGGNLLTGGLISATGNITGGNLISGNAVVGNINVSGDIAVNSITSNTYVSAIGNVVGGNVTTAGLISASGNINSGANIVATANVTGGNVTTAGQVTATGNVTGGNVTTAGQVTATGNVTGGNVLTSGVVSATGNVTGGNVLTSGIVSATGNITSSANVTGGNLLTSGLVSATGNINSGANIVATANVIGGNISTAGQVTATGNVTGGNVNTAGSMSATGNVYAANFIGNISGNLSAPGANTDVIFNDNNVANATAGFTFNKTANAVTVQGNITGGNILTGGNVSATGTLTASNASVFGNTTTGSDALYAGVPGGTNLGSNVVAQFTGNANSYIQVNMQNLSNLTHASTDYIATADNGNDTQNFINMGIVSSTFTDPTNFPGWGPNDSYLLNAGANLWIASEGASTIHFAPQSVGNVLVDMHANGKVHVSGEISVVGNVYANNISANTIAANTSGTFGNITVGPDGVTSVGSRITVNSNSADVDFAVNGDTTANVFYIDAGTGTASFGSSAQTANAIVAFNATNSILMPVGNTLQRPGTGVLGMLRFNNSTDNLEIYTSGGWEAVGVPAFTLIADNQFSGDGSTLIFTLTVAGTTASTIVCINGVQQIPTTAYAVSGTALTFTEAPLSGDVIDVRILTTTTTVTGLENGNTSIALVNNGPVNVTGNLNPTANVTYSLGNTTNRWANLWVGGNTITLGNTVIKNTTGNSIGFFGPDGTTPATIDAASVDTTQIASGTSNVKVVSANGNVTTNVGGTSNVMVISSTDVTITGNLSVSGNATLSGNILGDRIQNGTTQIDIQTTGGNANVTVGGTSNVAVFANTGVFVTGVISASGNITGNYILGNGSQLTGIDATSIQSGTSNVRVVSSGGNVTVSVAGSGNVAVFSTQGLSVGNIINSNANGIGNIGSSSNYFNTVFARATSAQYADLAEKYSADADYAPGTVVMFGGTAEVTICGNDACRRVAGVVSTNPSYIMNAGLDGEHIATVALTGRVPCRVTGTVRKGDMMVSAGNGSARAEANPAVGAVIGKALADSQGDAVIEVVVGRV